MFLLGIACYTDLRWRLILDKQTLPSITLGLVLALTAGVYPLIYALLQGIVLGGIFYLIYLKEGVGGGDVKLMAMLGVWLPNPLLANMFLATGAVLPIAGIVYGLLGRFSSQEKRPFPFALAIFVAGLIVYFTDLQ